MQTLKRYGVSLKSKEAHMDTKPLLKLAMSKYFGDPKGFVSMVVSKVPSPVEVFIHPRHTVPYYIIPYRTTPYRAVPYNTEPYHTIPSRTISCP